MAKGGDVDGRGDMVLTVAVVLAIIVALIAVHALEMRIGPIPRAR